MDSDAVRKQAAKVESKKLVPTSFGPNEDEDIVLQRQIVAQQKKRIQKDSLNAQIEVSEIDLSNYPFSFFSCRPRNKSSS